MGFAGVAWPSLPWFFTTIVTCAFAGADFDFVQETAKIDVRSWRPMVALPMSALDPKRTFALRLMPLRMLATLLCYEH